jgi:hypothetical protein
MSSVRRAPTRIVAVDWSTLWRGSGITRVGLLKLFWSTLRILLSGWVWGTAVRLAHIQQPVKTVGAILALIGLALFVWGLRGLWQGLRILGAKRLLIILLVVYGLIVGLNVLTAPSEHPLVDRIAAQMARAGQQTWDTFTGTIESVIKSPGDFLFAYTGGRAKMSPPPDIPTPHPEATPIEFHISGGSGSSRPAANLRVGGYARVASTDGQLLRARANPGTSSDIVTRIPEGERVRVFDGPISADGFKWWKVSSAQGEGWCAGQWLVPSD